MAERVCPWWLGPLFASPIRWLYQNPEAMLAPWVGEGMHVLDAGSAMGFFSIPLARLVGPSGRVVCVDLQERMIAGLKRRAVRAALADRMEFRVCTPASLQLDDLASHLDFALAFAVVHETQDQSVFFGEIIRALKPGGKLLLAEPRGHVTGEGFERTLRRAAETGFSVTHTVQIRGSLSRILRK